MWYGVYNLRRDGKKTDCDLSSISQFHLTAPLVKFLSHFSMFTIVLSLVYVTNYVEFIIPGNRGQKYFDNSSFQS